MHKIINTENDLTVLLSGNNFLPKNFIFFYQKEKYQLLVVLPKYIYFFNKNIKSYDFYERKEGKYFVKKDRRLDDSIDAIDFLNNELNKNSKIMEPCEVPFFSGGMVGNASFEALSELIGMSNADVNFPPMIFSMIDTFFVKDLLSGDVHIVFKKETSAAISFLYKKLFLDKKNQFSNEVFCNFYKFYNDINSIKKKEIFFNGADHVKSNLQLGNSFQTVISVEHEIKENINPINFFLNLHKKNSKYKYIISFFGYSIVSVSPENLFELSASGKVSMTPLAGTRPKTDDPVKNKQYQRDLKNNQKEAAEHAMLVDLSRNDLGMVCAPGTIAVENYRYIEEHGSVIHLASKIVGLVEKKITGFDVMRALSPAGTMSGAPKIRSIEIIKEAEQGERGYYSGNAGFVGFNGESDFSIIIRTLTFSPGRISLRAGAGIVLGSNAEEEFNECVQKMYSVGQFLS